ncbi:MAG: F0F1 ATP synthase subunit epsilon [Clostridia bacterium]|nr:F0F1 ATP synthase subunit epsilon [Clostridia bacterium]
MNTYPLEILTPKKRFFKGNVESVKLHCIDGELVILKNHIPMYGALDAGEIVVTDSIGRHCFKGSDGFVVVHPDHVIIFLMQIQDNPS